MWLPLQLLRSQGGQTVPLEKERVGMKGQLHSRQGHSQEGARGKHREPPKTGCTKPWEENSSEGGRTSGERKPPAWPLETSLSAGHTGARQPTPAHSHRHQRLPSDEGPASYLLFLRLPEHLHSPPPSSQSPLFPVIAPNRKLRSPVS